jgi:hypothetical protein
VAALDWRRVVSYLEAKQVEAVDESPDPSRRRPPKSFDQSDTQAASILPVTLLMLPRFLGMATGPPNLISRAQK